MRSLLVCDSSTERQRRHHPGVRGSATTDRNGDGVTAASDSGMLNQYVDHLDR